MLAATVKDREARCSLAYMAQVWLRLDHDEGQQGIGILKVPRKPNPQSNSNNKSNPRMAIRSRLGAEISARRRPRHSSDRAGLRKTQRISSNPLYLDRK